MTVRSGAQLLVIRRAIYSRPAFAESMRHILCPRDAWVRRRTMVTEAELAAVPGYLAPRTAVADSLDNRKAVLG